MNIIEIPKTIIEKALKKYFKDATYIDITADESDVEYQQFINNFTDCLNEVLDEDNKP